MNYMAPLPIVINTIQLKMVTMIIIDPAEEALRLLLGLSLASVLGTLAGDIHNAIKQRHKIK